MENTSVEHKIENKNKNRKNLNLLNSEMEKGKIWNGKSVPLDKEEAGPNLAAVAGCDLPDIVDPGTIVSLAILEQWAEGGSGIFGTTVGIGIQSFPADGQGVHFQR